jgi:hypothetical protein
MSEPIKLFYVVSLQDCFESEVVTVVNLASLADMFVGHRQANGGEIDEYFAIFTEHEPAKAFARYRALLAKTMSRLGELSPTELVAVANRLNHPDGPQL